MGIIEEGGIHLGRMMLIKKDGSFKQEDLQIEANGKYDVLEKDDCFVLKNAW